MAATTPAFDVIGRVATGSSAVVWKAFDTRLGRTVALKEITGQSAAEAQALALVSSPHVVAIHGVVEDADRVYLVEEWVDGAPLREVLRAAGGVSAAQALAVARGALLGLAEVHRLGLVHGDVSLSNILVDHHGNSTLIDFGSVTRTGEKAGRATGAFAAPEVGGGGPVTARADVYAAAAVFAVLLHGRIEAAPSLRGVDAGIRPVLERALSAASGDRYADAAEFLAALEDAAQRRYGPDWYSVAGLGALAAGVTAEVVAVAAPNAPFAGPSVVAGAGVAAAAGTTVGAAGVARSADATAEVDRTSPTGPRRARRPRVLVGAGAVVVLAAVVAAVVAASGSDPRPAAQTVPSVGASSSTSGAPVSTATPPLASTGPSGPVQVGGPTWSGTYDVTPPFNGDGLFRPGAISNRWVVSASCGHGSCPVTISLSNGGKATYQYAAGRWTYRYADKYPCPAFQGVFTATVVPVAVSSGGMITKLRATYRTRGHDCQGGKELDSGNSTSTLTLHQP